MKLLKFFGIWILFGITMVKSEAVSWYRIQEMFRFESFHMYGIIGVAVAFGLLFISLIKRYNIKSSNGEPIQFNDKAKTYKRYLIGGAIFGLGWSLVGACPGPLYILAGGGYVSILVIIVGAILGTFTYGLLRDKLPH